MIVTAWNNGAHHATGAGYGLKISIKDRDRCFRREWGTVLLELPGRDDPVEINIDKDSFWAPTCPELISKEIGLWLRANGYAPWPTGRPPRFPLDSLGGGRFELGAHPDRR